MSDVTRTEPKRVEVTDEELSAVLTVAIAEWVLGWKRITGKRGDMQWVGIDLMTGGEWTYVLASLPPFVRDPGLAVLLFTKIATDHDLIPELRIDNRLFASAMQTPVHVKFTRRVEIQGGGGKVRYRYKPVVGVSSTNVARTIALALVELYESTSAVEFDRGRLHRELFPARYLVAV